jgi:hypothetical protein
MIFKKIGIKMKNKKLLMLEKNNRYFKNQLRKKNFIHKKNNNFIKIKIMSDYSADGLWKDEIAIDINDLPQNLLYLKNRIDKWQYLFESFNLYNKEKIELKIFENSILFKNWITEGLKIAIKINNSLGYKYNVYYFIEDTTNVIYIDKKNNLKIIKSNLFKKYSWD